MHNIRAFGSVFEDSFEIIIVDDSDSYYIKYVNSCIDILKSNGVQVKY